MADVFEYIDIYIHEGKSDDPDDNIISDELSLFFQEVEMAISIAPNEIWGVKDGINLSRYLFNKYVTVTQIKNEITEFITKNCQHAGLFQYKISTETLKDGNNNDMIYIVMNVVAIDPTTGNPENYRQKFLIGS